MGPDTAIIGLILAVAFGMLKCVDLIWAWHCEKARRAAMADSIVTSCAHPDAVAAKSSS